jgi:tRNA A-37 threonylcarbamoyl transferase component Bud32
VRRLRDSLIRRNKQTDHKRCFKENTLFTVYGLGRRKVFARRDFPIQEVQKIFEDTISVSNHQNQKVLKLSPQSCLKVHRITLGGRNYSLCSKVYPSRGLFHVLRCSLIPSKARAFWKGWWVLKSRGFRVPEVYLIWEERRLRLLIGCGVVMETVEEGLGLDRYASKNFLPPLEFQGLKRKRELIFQMANTLAKLHVKGILHRDLKASNVLVKEYDDSLGIVLLDLDVVRFRGSISRRHIALNLAQIDASLPSCVTKWDRLRFLSKYWDKRGNREGLRALAREATRLSILRRRRR